MDTRIQSIEAFEEKIEQLMKQCKALTDTTTNASSTEILGDVSVFKNITDNCVEIQRHLDILKGTTNDNINIICVGNTSTGKSALMNALIGKAIMPSSALTTTRCFTRLSRSDKNMVKIPDGETTICETDEMVKDAIDKYMDKLTKTNEMTEAEIQVYLDIDSPILRNNVYLYDSPGEGQSSNVSDLIKHRCKDMDIMIIVMPYDIANFIENNYEGLANYVTKIPVFILINKWDKACKNTTPNQIENTKSSTLSYVKRAFITPHNIESVIDNELLFYISAKEIVEYYPKAPENAKGRQRYDDFQTFKSRLSNHIINCTILKDKRFNEIMNKVKENYNQQQNMYNTRIMEIRNQILQRVLAWITEQTDKRMKCDQLIGCMNGEVLRRISEQTNQILGRLREMEARLRRDVFDIINENGMFDIIRVEIGEMQRRYNDAINELRNQILQLVSSSTTEVTGIRMNCNQPIGCMNDEVFRRISEQTNQMLGRLREIEMRLRRDGFDIINENRMFDIIRVEIGEMQLRYNDAINELRMTHDSRSRQYDDNTRYYQNKYHRCIQWIETWIQEGYLYDNNSRTMRDVCDGAYNTYMSLLKRLTFVSQAPTDNVSIMCIGKVSVGKSKIINSIIEENIMTSAGSHTTRCFVRISKGDTNRVVSPNGEINVFPTNEEIKYAVRRINGEVSATDGSEIQIYLNNDSTILDNNVYLYDTPGLGLDDDMPEFLITKCKDIDIIILVINNNVPKNIENIFQTIAEYTTEIPTFILVNKWDQTDDTPGNTITELRTQLNTAVREIFKSKYQIYYVSGMEAFQQIRLHQVTVEGKMRQRYEEFKKFKSSLLDAIKSGCKNNMIRRDSNLKIIRDTLHQCQRQYANRNEFRNVIESLMTPWNDINSTVTQLIENVDDNETTLDNEINALISSRDLNTYKINLNALDTAHADNYARILLIEPAMQDLLLDQVRTNIEELRRCVARMELFKRRIESQSGSWGSWFLHWFTWLIPGWPGYEEANDEYWKSVENNNRSSQREYRKGYAAMRDVLRRAGDICSPVIVSCNALLVVLQ